jgi:hypothetical protein
VSLKGGFGPRYPNAAEVHAASKTGSSDQPSKVCPVVHQAKEEATEQSDSRRVANGV